MTLQSHLDCSMFKLKAVIHSNSPPKCITLISPKEGEAAICDNVMIFSILGGKHWSPLRPPAQDKTDYDYSFILSLNLFYYMYPSIF